MAIFNHPHGFSGRIGGLVFRRMADGRTSVSQAPRLSHLEPTARQLESRYRFRQATQYAKAMLANPQRAQWYADLSARLHKSAFALAVADYYKYH